MIVLGLAGHVDHGKTTLVRSLTGTDTDRLPEEKARGMTTDLGFASLDLRDKRSGRSVALGVVDVPGHERYIRNMAAGAWGVDLALLVIAADDGWMAQTETHARVLAAFGPPRVIPVVTKIDKVQPGRAEDVAEDSLRRARTVLGAASVVSLDASSVPLVSALSGTGLDDLRSAIASEAFTLETSFCSLSSASAEPATPYLYVDRVFSKRGAGLVLCGTLRDGAVSAGDVLIHVPSGEKIRVRGVESLGTAADRAFPRSRAAFNVAGLKAPASRGDLITGADCGQKAFLRGTEFLVVLENVPYSDSRPLTPFRAERETETELVVGSAVRFARCYAVGKGPFARLLCRNPIAVPLESKGALVRHGGSELLSAVRFIREGTTDRESRRQIAAAVAGLENANAALARFVLSVRLVSWLKDDAKRPELEDSASAFDIIRIGAYYITKPAWLAAEAAIRRLSAAPGGLDRAALPSSLNLPPDLAELLAADFFPPEQGSPAISPASETLPTSSAVPSWATAAAERLKRSGPEGYDAAPPAPGVKRRGPGFSAEELSALCRLKLAIPIDRVLFLHSEVYRSLVALVLKKRTVGDRLSIADIKAATGYSRKYALPFINRMERDGFVRRDGDFRIITNIPSGT